MVTADEQLISLQPGTIIASRYEVVKCLGAGSVGLVYACRHRDLPGHLVAVKVLFPEVAQDRVAAARFRNEIIASYGVSHPNVVRAYEYLRDGDLVAYTMEYVDGGALADRLDKGAPRIQISEAVRLLAQMCAGVQAIHDAGIVHRDLKPENILLTRDGNVKIADFGIARTGSGPRLTEHGGVVGTIAYVSPEYMLNSQVDWRSDIYALGILAYEMVTGKSPFEAESVYATMTKRLKSDPTPPNQMRSDCPDSFNQIILRAMARDPEERYQSAAEIFSDLKDFMPEIVMTSGVSPQLPQRGSDAYVGPRVAPQVPGAPIQSDSSLVAHGVEQRSYGIPPPSASKEYPHEYSYREPVVGYQSSTPPPQESNRVRLSEPDEYDSERAPTSNRAFNGERNNVASWNSREDAPVGLSVMDDHIDPLRTSRAALLAPPGQGSASLSMGQAHQGQDRSSQKGRSSGQYWLPSSRGGDEFGTHREGMDNDRLKKLTELADAGAPSLMGDILFIVGAALVGIAFGFIVITVFFPEVLSKTMSG